MQPISPKLILNRLEAGGRCLAREILPFAFTLVATLLTVDTILMAYGKHSCMNEFFQGMLRGTAEGPYAYRVLLPFLINTCAQLTPDAIADAILKAPTYANETTRAQAMIARYRIQADGLELEYFIAYIFSIAACIGTCYTWRFTLKFVREPERSPLFCAFAPGVALLFIPQAFRWGAYFYDFTDLLLVSLCMLFFLKRKWWAYYPLFILAILNKESNVLMAAWLAALLFERSYLPLAKHGVLHILIGSITFLMTHYYVSAPSTSSHIYMLFGEHVKFLLQPSSYSSFWPIYAPSIPIPAGLNVLNLTFLIILLAAGWKKKNRTVRILFLVSAITVFPFFLVGGYQDELRVFMLAFPSLFLLACDTALTQFQTNPNPGASNSNLMHNHRSTLRVKQ